MIKNVLVLGAGLVGRPIALDLAKSGEFRVSTADTNADSLDKFATTNIRAIIFDISQKEKLLQLLKGFDLVVNAVPGFMGYETLKTCILAGKNTADIAFYPEDVLELHKLAKEKKVTIISDIGVAPGMSNLLTAWAVSQLTETDSVKIYVGGLPKIRQLPWEYKAVFSPSDVIEEYTRPARIIENWKTVVKKPLTEIELLNFEKVGTLEAFNSDGLRSLLHTVKARYMVEKTLRYPGYAAKIKLLIQNGFLEKEKRNVKGQWISPLAITENLLFEQWKLSEGEADITVMKIVVEGWKQDCKYRYTFDLYDEYDVGTGIHSMARTTGFTAAMALRLLAAQLLNETGVYVPEFLGGEEKFVRFFLDGLAQKGIVYRQKTERIN